MILQNRNRRSRIQSAFTLVEMLVVIVLVLVVTTLVVMATMRMTDKDTVPHGAGMLQGYFAKARTTALADRKPTGVRLLVTNPLVAGVSNPPGVTPPNALPPWPPFPTDGLVVIEQIQYIHDPGDFADSFVTTDLDGDPTNGPDLQRHPDTGVVLMTSDPLYGRLVYGPARPPQVLVSQEPYVGFSFGDATNAANSAVYPGDAVELNGGGQMARVEFDPANLAALGVTRSVYHPSQTHTDVNRTLLVLDRKLDRSVQTPNVNTPTVNYRIMRQPRPVPGEEPIKLPRNIFVVAADFRDAIYTAGAQRRESLPRLTANADILFDPSGRVVSTGLESIFLWVSDVPSVEINPDTPGVPFDTNWAIVGIKTRTGAVSIYPVNQQTTDYFYYARIGRGSGM